MSHHIKVKYHDVYQSEVRHSNGHNEHGNAVTTTVEKKPPAEGDESNADDPSEEIFDAGDEDMTQPEVLVCLSWERHKYVL